MMKKKAKRYQVGGEAEDKRRGLAASKGENVGFFERLRMGNIDDPKSEAYKRFGAGRGQTESAKEREAIKAYKGPSERDFGSPDSPSPFTGSTGRDLTKATPAKTPAKAKPAIVTKEQLKASGFDNLRDYLNAQRGLTRRGESAPRKPAAAAPRGSYRGTQEEGDAGEAEARKAQEAKVAAAKARRKEAADYGDTGLTAKQATAQYQAQKKADAEVDNKKTGSQRMAAKADRAGNIYARSSAATSQSAKEKQEAARKRLGTVEPRPPRGFSSPAARKAWDDKYGDKYQWSGKKKPGMASGGTVKMKAGGSVSSASKRADGIAVRGKTRCKVM